MLCQVVLTKKLIPYRVVRYLCCCGAGTWLFCFLVKNFFSGGLRASSASSMVLCGPPPFWACKILLTGPKILLIGGYWGLTGVGGLVIMCVMSDNDSKVISW